MKYLYATLLFLMTTITQAATVFTPSDGDVDFFTLSLDGGGLNPGMLFALTPANTLPGSAYPLVLDGTGSVELPASEITTTAGLPTFSVALFDTHDWHFETVAFPIGDDAALLRYDFDHSGPPESMIEALGESCCEWEFDHVTLAVVDGSAAVPVPAAVWLMGSGLIGLAGVARRVGA